MASDPKRPITVTEMVTVKQERRDIEYSWTDLLDTFDYSSIVSQLMIRVEEVATERDAAIARAERLAAECRARRGRGRPMREWKHGEVCSHGSLGRKCEICWRDDEIAALRARAEKAEAEAAEWKAASAINGSNMAGYQTRSIVAEERLVKAEARAERLAAECRLWREWAGDVLTGWPCVNGQPITAAVDAHRDLEGGAA